MKMFRLMLTIALVLMTAIAALAVDAVPVAAVNPFGAALSGFMTNDVFPILGAMVLGFFSWAAKKVGDKYKIAGLQDSNGFLMQLAAQGVAFAEEKAANFAKNAQPLTGNDKLNAAIAYLLQNAPKVTVAQAQSLVTAALATLPGVGATGATAVVVPISSAAIAPANTSILVQTAALDGAPITGPTGAPGQPGGSAGPAGLLLDPLAVAP